MKITAYHRPETLDKARSLLRDLGPAGIPLAGATSHAFMKGDDEKTGVDLAALGLDTITATPQGFAIGAMARIADLQAFAAPGWVLDRVALRFVSQPMRNMTTLGGNLARVFPWNDFPVALLALDATLDIAGDTVTTHPAATFFKGQPARLFKPGDLLTAIHVPAVGPGCGFGYHKETVVNMDFSLFTAAAWVRRDKRSLAEVRIAVGAGVPLPQRLIALEDALTGKAFSRDTVRAAVIAHAEAVSWKGGDGYSADYIRQLALTHLEDALHTAWNDTAGGAV